MNVVGNPNRLFIMENVKITKSPVVGKDMTHGRVKRGNTSAQKLKIGIGVVLELVIIPPLILDQRDILMRIVLVMSCLKPQYLATFGYHKLLRKEGVLKIVGSDVRVMVV